MGRHRLVQDEALPQGGVGGRDDRGQHGRIPETEAGEDRHRSKGAAQDGERESDQQESGLGRMAPPQRGDIDVHGVREQDEAEGHLGQGVQHPCLGWHRDQAERRVAHQEPQQDEDERSRQRCRAQLRRGGSEQDGAEGEDDEEPRVHVAVLSEVRSGEQHVCEPPFSSACRTASSRNRTPSGER